ncbi:hypothetical protein N0V84_002210 [Fusarium piperis]|uniref:LysM domain-containing protein n=1 Tax=Fusarium piperis TaxID=1435070 RepID=A0A9W8WJH8_9HYPO|nr:hypothetical protein N0V84_002210 [Fusarium piperis]
MVFTMAVKATALLLTLPSVANGTPVLPPPQVNMTLTEDVPVSAALAITPGLEYLLGPDVPHISDPRIVLGPDVKLTNDTLLSKDNSWYKEILQRLSIGDSSTNNNNNTTQPRKKHSKRWVTGSWGYWTDYVKLFEKLVPAKWDNWPAEITLINATPYRWTKGHTHSYQLVSWDLNWPNHIEPGQTVRVTTSTEAMSPWDAAGEVVYHLEGVSKPASFEIRRRTPPSKNRIFGGGLPNELSVTYRENLETLKRPKKSVNMLKWWDFPGSCQWVLAGKEGDFIADDAGPGWMSERMDHIGQIPLRELAIPRSHHAGMYKMNEAFGLGSLYNTITQYKDLTYQLTEGGVRVIDIRPFLKYGKRGYETWESHGSIFGGKWHGGLGVTLKDMVDQVNAFNEKHPGELIIWDIHPSQALVRRHAEGTVVQMSEGDRAIMYNEFKRLKHRLEVPNGRDLTQWPLERFVGNKTSGVLIRTRREWREDESWPGGSEGFVTEANFPVHQLWANSPDTPGLIDATVKDLKERKTDRSSTLFFADWILTQQGFDVAFGNKFIAEMAITTYKAMFYELWEALTMDRYPNWIATDGIRSNELKSFAMAINHCLAGGRCGKIKPSKKPRIGPDHELGFYETLIWKEDLEEATKGMDKKKAEEVIAKAMAKAKVQVEAT